MRRGCLSGIIEGSKEKNHELSRFRYFRNLRIFKESKATKKVKDLISYYYMNTVSCFLTTEYLVKIARPDPVGLIFAVPS